MAKLTQEFDSSNYDEGDGDFAPMPAGWYRGKIEESDIKPTNAGTGKYVWLQIRIVGPTHANRVVFDQINVVNPSETAMQIGRRQLANLARAVGVPRFDDTAQLHGKVLEVKLKINRSQEYGDKNQVAAYRAVNDMLEDTSFSGGGTGSAQPQTQPQPSGSFSDDEIPF